MSFLIYLFLKSEMLRNFNGLMGQLSIIRLHLYFLGGAYSLV